MNIRKLAFVVLTLGLVLIVSGSFSLFLQGLREDKQQILNRIDDVGDEFEVFSANTSIFEEYRESLYEEILEGVVCDSLKDNAKKVNNKLSNYENLVDELEKTTVTLDNLCKNVYYPDIETNTKCNNYKSIYEQVNNYFISDIAVYNKNIDKYNDYQKSKNSDSKLEKYKIRRDYIDYNNDGKYDGKEG
jgi:hypothetical protein